MSSFPRSPSVTRGAIITFDLPNPVPKAIIFQYNPDTMSRSLTAAGSKIEGEEEDRTEPTNLPGPPTETISLDIELDATDQLESQDLIATTMGIYPQLSALELMMYPKSSLIIENAIMQALGMTEVLPSQGPFTLFIWGIKRVVPVRITSYTVEEQAYDTNLNPIRAKVSLTMRVLTSSDLSVEHPGYALYLAHHIIKETMGIIGTLNSVVTGVTSLV